MGWGVIIVHRTLKVPDCYYCKNQVNKAERDETYIQHFLYVENSQNYGWVGVGVCVLWGFVC